MLDLIRNSAEYRNWGLNWATVGVIGIAVFAIFELWALRNQNKRIWSSRSGDGLSVQLFTYQWSLFAASIFYGLATNRLAVAANCILLILFLVPIIWGLWKFERWTRFEKRASLLFLLQIPFMIIVPWKEAGYILISAGLIYSTSTQAWEIWTKKDVGVLDIRLIWVYTASCTFWGLYGFAIDALALKVLNPIIVSLFLVIWGLWHKYRVREPQTI